MSAAASLRSESMTPVICAPRCRRPRQTRSVCRSTREMSAFHRKLADLRSNQLRVHGDLGQERPGNRAILLGVLGQSIERCLIQIRYARAQCQGGATNTEALAVVLFEGDDGLGIELGWGEPCGLQSKGQGHREASCV